MTACKDLNCDVAAADEYSILNMEKKKYCNIVI